MLTSSKKKEIFSYVLIIPGILLLLVVVFLPFLQNIYYSFTDYSLLKAEESFIGLENYKNILGGDEFFGALWKSLVYVTIVIILIGIIGVGAAFIQN